MRKHFIIMGLAVGLAVFLSLGAGTKTDAAGDKVSTQLRKDWNLEDLKTTRKAVEAGKFPQDIRKSAIDAIDSYLSQQEKLLTGVDTQKDNGAAAKKSKATLETEFQQKMKGIYGNPEYKAELEKRIKALKDEMNAEADKANSMFENMNSGKKTTQPASKTSTKPSDGGKPKSSK